MTNHRARLIEQGLYTPLPNNVLYNREDLLARIKDGYKASAPPAYCVYRADSPWSHIHPEVPTQCKEAELIEDRLTSYEAHCLCDRLNARDPEQPRRKSYLPPLGMYRVCHMDEWHEWEARHSQVKMEEIIWERN